MRNIWQKIIDYGLLSALVIFPLSINIALISPEDILHPLVSINFSLADLLIGLLLFIWVLKVVFFKEYKQIKFPPLPVWVFLGVIVISFINATSLSKWAKEVIQTTEYFILLYFLLLNNLKFVNTGAIFKTFYVSASIFLLISLIQYMFLKADAYLVRALFENRNYLGAFLCITTPLIYFECIHSDKIIVKIWMSILLIITGIVLVSGSAMIAIIVGLGAISWKYGKRIFVRYMLAIILVGSIYPFIMPLKNINAIKDFLSVYEQGSISKKYYRRLALLTDTEKNTLLKKEINENSLEITSNKFFVVNEPDFQDGDAYKELGSTKLVKNEYLEMLASINLISENALLGVGAGNFQDNIGAYYNELPKINTTEPGLNNGYLIIASTVGILGLSSLLWIFFAMLRNSLDQINSTATVKHYQIGLYGTILACMVENMFVYLFSGGMLIPFLFIVYLSFDKKNR